VVSDGDTWSDFRHGRTFVDRYAKPLRGGCETPHQPGWLNPSAVRAPGGTDCASNVDPLTQLVGAQHDQIVRSPAESALACEPARKSAVLCGVGCHLEQPVLTDVRVDPLRIAYPDDLVHSVKHRPLHRHRGLDPANLGIPLGLAWHLCAEPAAVSTGCAETSELAFQHRDPQIRLGCLEVVRGPQAGEAAANDRNVDLRVRLERGPSGWHPQFAVPVRHFAVDEVGSPLEVSRHRASAPSR
jgi:hypothetical protein